MDLRANYYAHHGWFFGLAVLDALVSIEKDFILTGTLPERTNFGFHVLITSYIAMLFAHLR